jgi:hypothetical protein
MIADAQARPLSEGGCEGTETAQWSSDGFRVYTRTDLTCGANVRRSVSGIMAMVTPKTWVNVQSIGAGEQGLSRTVRYTATDLSGVPEDIAVLATPNALAGETVRWASTEPLDLADIREALRMVDHGAVEALVLARNEPFDIDAGTLIALDSEGVPASTIDALVAVSHPEQFAVVAEPEVTAYAADYFSGLGFGVSDRNYDRRYCGAYDPWFDPYGASELCYGGYSYLGMSRYNRNFGRYGYGWGYGYRPVIVVRNPNPTDPVAPSRRGTVSRNGYRSGSSSSGPARSRTSNPSSSSVNTTRASSGSESTTTGSRNSSNNSSNSTGRTAKRRGSGGN